jgi:alpha-tubulin suppressor-like RCC1 family protein
MPSCLSARRAGFGSFLLVGCLACGGGADDQEPRVAALSAGRAHTCALFENGDLRCWGTAVAPSYGVLLVDLGGRPIQIESGAYSACALLQNQRVKCWGDNAYGQLGRSGNGALEASKTVPYVELGDGVLVRKLGVGGFFACVLTTDDRVKCWGRNIYGELGLGDKIDRGAAAGTMGDDLPYVDLASSAKPVELTLGLDPACALFDNGKVKCWGANYGGSLGVGDFQHRGDEPDEMGDALPFVDLGPTPTQHVSAGGHACALQQGGTVKCWGSNLFGQLGRANGSNADDPGPRVGVESEIPVVDLGAGRTVTQIALGLLHTCVVLDGAQVKCWGQNDYGQLGLGDRRSRGIGVGEMGDALPVIDLGQGARVKQLVAGEHHNCALLESGDIKCWGRNEDGQLGRRHRDNVGTAPNQMGENLVSTKPW